MRPKKLVKEKKRKIPMFVRIILLVVLLVFVYVLGVNHGAMRTAFAIGSEHCELIEGYMPIFPYGCEHNDSLDNYCIDMNCQALSLGLTPAYDNNGAVCFKFNESEVRHQRLSAFIVGWGLTGCPTKMHTIGMNKYTSNRNWIVNKIEMDEWNKINSVTTNNVIHDISTICPNGTIEREVRCDCCPVGGDTCCAAYCFECVAKQ